MITCRRGRADSQRSGRVSTCRVYCLHHCRLEGERMSFTARGGNQTDICLSKMDYEVHGQAPVHELAQLFQLKVAMLRVRLCKACPSRESLHRDLPEGGGKSGGLKSAASNPGACIPTPPSHSVSQGLTSFATPVPCASCLVQARIKRGVHNKTNSGPHSGPLPVASTCRGQPRL